MKGFEVVHLRTGVMEILRLEDFLVSSSLCRGGAKVEGLRVLKGFES